MIFGYNDQSTTICIVFNTCEKDVISGEMFARGVCCLGCFSVVLFCFLAVH